MRPYVWLFTYRHVGALGPLTVWRSDLASVYGETVMQATNSSVTRPPWAEYLNAQFHPALTIQVVRRS